MISRVVVMLMLTVVVDAVAVVDDRDIFVGLEFFIDYDDDDKGGVEWRHNNY